MAPFITLADLASLGYDTTQTADQVPLTRICEIASSITENYINQPVQTTSTNFEQSIFIRGNLLTISPPYLPVQSITSLIVYDYLGTTQLTDLTAAARIKTGQGAIAAPCILPTGNYTVQCAYICGYAVIPLEIISATLLVAQPLCDDYFFTKITGLGGLSQIREGQQQVTRNDLTDLPQQAKILLDCHKRVR